MSEVGGRRSEVGISEVGGRRSEVGAIYPRITFYYYRPSLVIRNILGCRQLLPCFRVQVRCATKKNSQEFLPIRRRHSRCNYSSTAIIHRNHSSAATIQPQPFNYSAATIYPPQPFNRSAATIYPPQPFNRSAATVHPPQPFNRSAATVHPLQLFNYSAATVHPPQPFIHSSATIYPPASIQPFRP
jgi:hypothetical protein